MIDRATLYSDRWQILEERVGGSDCAERQFVWGQRYLDDLVVRDSQHVGPFDPASLPGLALWLKADAITGLSDGDPVGSWADSSSAGNDTSQTDSAKKPLYKTNILNGLPVVRFDGSNDTLDAVDADSLDIKRATFFAVLTFRGAGTGNHIWLMKNATGTGGACACGGLRYSATHKWQYDVNAGSGWQDAPSNTVLNDDDWHILAATYDGSSVQLYLDGAGDGSHAETGDIMSTTGKLQVGGYNASFGGSEYAQCDIAEILVYDNAMSTTDRQLVEQYLNEKYNLPMGGSSSSSSSSGSCAPLSQRLYVFSDYFQPTAIVDTADSIQERYGYDAFGTSRVMDASFGLRSASLYEWETRFGSYRWDSESSLDQVRNRCLHDGLGRWLTRDPFDYPDGPNSYAYVSNNPETYLERILVKVGLRIIADVRI